MMKRIVIVGIVLLTLLALTGVVSADITSRTDIQADVKPYVSITLSGDVTDWQLNQGINVGPVRTIAVESNCGYNVQAADKSDPSPCLDTKPNPGYLDTWGPGTGCDWKWGTNKLTNQLHVTDYGVHSFDKALTGSDQLLYTGLVGDVSVPFTFKQDVALLDKPAGAYGQSGYRSIVTFTVTSN
jgi:hypothetical protein